jgi:hypothetical protein
MQDKATYNYTIIRLVPRVEREEFLNVGVILFSKPKKFLEIKYYIDQQKLSALSPTVNAQFIIEYLKAWEAICSGEPSSGPIGQLDLAERFRWLAATKSTMLQCSPTHTGLCSDPEKELLDLFERYVL